MDLFDWIWKWKSAHTAVTKTREDWWDEMAEHLLEQQQGNLIYFSDNL